MMKYRILSTGNTILADQAFVDAQYPDDHELIPEEPIIVPAETRMTRLEFQLRFTFDELVAIETVAETNAGVRVLQKQQQVAEYIDLADPNTQLGVMYLVSQGLLTNARGLEILTP
jgi:hypothetical protein